MEDFRFWPAGCCWLQFGGLGGCQVLGNGEMLILMNGGCLNLVARAIAVVPSRKPESCCFAMGCDSLILSWVASVVVVIMRGILVMGSPRSGCDRC